MVQLEDMSKESLKKYFKRRFSEEIEEGKAVVEYLDIEDGGDTWDVYSGNWSNINNVIASWSYDYYEYKVSEGCLIHRRII